ncbi:PGAP1-like protein [Rubrivivax sp. A210]|uniref:esterase/lipase family protein n=1 Tax=Rubrivivax sp. A210 TaxID=2772301 RepID=UPI001917CA95|nr:alpha/beta hydrolase [Rubrivivax sp. A210]CAD5371800.1 PGAP1-like protein [Rubrivivax sp. A210]
MTDLTAPTPPRRIPLRAADLRGLAQLGVDGVLGVADIAEALHHTITSVSAPLGRATEGRTGGITGFVYRSVRGTTRLVGQGLGLLLDALPRADAGLARDPAREAWLAVLGGVWGDHLEETANPLAIPMALRRPDKAQASGRIAVLIHGLCMNDLQWRRRGHDHGALLARERGWSPVYLHYNSGLHVSHNGRELAAQLAALVASWPVPVTELALIGHSMGGLVARSACHAGAEMGMEEAWMGRLTRLVCLGTPHQGAPLERGGRLVDGLLGISPYGAPFARLGRARSAGITDLRYGNVQDADWQARSRHAQRAGDRQLTPLPAGVATFLAAATTARQAKPGLRSALLGDGLVPVASALGDHRDPAQALGVHEDRRLVVTGANHWDLLDHPAVAAKLLAWLA